VCECASDSHPPTLFRLMGGWMLALSTCEGVDPALPARDTHRGVCHWRDGDSVVLPFLALSQWLTHHHTTSSLMGDPDCCSLPSNMQRLDIQLGPPSLERRPGSAPWPLLLPTYTSKRPAAVLPGWTVAVTEHGYHGEWRLQDRVRSCVPGHTLRPLLRLPPDSQGCK
jgi:hypothetical protein